MIESILKISADKLNQLSTTHKLNTHERILLTELVEILAPFEEATKYVQFEKNVSASYIVPCIRGLRAQFENASATNSFKNLCPA